MVWPSVSFLLAEGLISSGSERQFTTNGRFDVRDLLPGSLKGLYLHGYFTNLEWNDLTTPLRGFHPGTPVLSRIRVERRAYYESGDIEQVYGNALCLPLAGSTIFLFNLLVGHGRD